MMHVKGIVEHGSGLGKVSFVPTINLIVEEIPAELEFGIYVCLVVIDGVSFGGALHYGSRSSIDNLITFEINIFDFNEEIYGKEVSVDILEKIRNIIVFENHEALKAQILDDIKQAKKILHERKDS